MHCSVMRSTLMLPLSSAFAGYGSSLELASCFQLLSLGTPIPCSIIPPCLRQHLDVLERASNLSRTSECGPGSVAFLKQHFQSCYCVYRRLGFCSAPACTHTFHSAYTHHCFGMSRESKWDGLCFGRHTMAALVQTLWGGFSKELMTASV